MEKRELTVCDFRKIYKSHPENLFCFPFDILKQAYAQGNHEQRIAILSECFVRDFLFCQTDKDIESFINACLPNNELDAFRLNLPDSSHHSPAQLDMPLWHEDGDFSCCCATVVQERMRKLFHADGLIPLFMGHQAFLLPFHFENTPHDKLGAFDLSGQEITEWSNYLNLLNITSRLVVHYTVLNPFPKLTGNSLMLPVLMAWWRSNETLPEYDAFRTLATGTFDSELRLRDVETVAKEALISPLLSERPDTVLYFRPKSRYDNNAPKGTILLDNEIPKEKLLHVLQEKLEGHVKCSAQYSIKHLYETQKIVRHESYANWDHVIKRLENLACMDNADPAQAEAYLINLILRSECYSHNGNTKKAKEYNQIAIDFAKRKISQNYSLTQNGFLSQLLLAKIEHLIHLQDDEEIQKAVDYIKVIEQEIETSQDIDLLMRFYGTAGRTYAYAALSGTPDIEPKMSLKCFERALGYAEELGKPEEIAQDKNQLHLYFALFEPGSVREHEAYRQAENSLEQVKKTNRDCAIKNRHFLMQQKAFSGYRELLQTHECPGEFCFSDYSSLLSSHANQRIVHWLRATMEKYLGALEAARNNMDAAQKLLRDAVDALPTEKNPGIFSLIKLTIMAEAYRSLKDTTYLEEARELATRLPKNYATDLWQKYLEEPTENTFPGLQYWY